MVQESEYQGSRVMPDVGTSSGLRDLRGFERLKGEPIPETRNSELATLINVRCHDSTMSHQRF